MVVFKPDLTKFLVFDLEAFVPSVDRRKRIGASLAVNAFREGHTLLGGVVYGGRPLAGEVVLDYAHYWMWREGGEKEVVAGRLQARLFWTTLITGCGAKAAKRRWLPPFTGCLPRCGRASGTRR